jgi:hypothetical protein
LKPVRHCGINAVTSARACAIWFLYRVGAVTLQATLGCSAALTIAAVRTFRRRLVVALGVGVLFALLQIGGVVRSNYPAWAKITWAALLIGVAVGGGFISAKLGSDKRRFTIAVMLVVVAEVVAGNVFVNAACYLGGCG